MEFDEKNSPDRVSILYYKQIMKLKRGITGNYPIYRWIEVDRSEYLDPVGYKEERNELE